MTNTKIIKGNKYSLTEMNPIQLRLCPLTLLLYNFALMGIIYGGVYIGPVLRHHMDYTRVTRATCVLKLFMVTSHDVLLAT